MMYAVKVVPDDAPNDDGFWVGYLKKAPKFDDVVLAGHHIVQVVTMEVVPPDQPFYMHSGSPDSGRGD